MKSKTLLLISFLIIVNTSSFAVWSKFAYVSPETEEKFDIKVIVEDHVDDSGLVKIKILTKGHRGKVASLVETEKPLPQSTQEALRYVLWGRSDLPIKIIFKTRLSHNQNSFQEKRTPLEGDFPKGTDQVLYEIETKVCNRNLYVYIDFPRAVADGGFWYSIDLKKYLTEIKC